MSERVRLTITVPQETHAVFQQMADVSGVSLGRCMGDWLTDTAEGAQIVLKRLVEARNAPKLVMREFRAMAVGLVDEIDEVHRELQAGGWKANGDRSPAARAGSARRGAGDGAKRPAPSSNTGLKSPAKSGANGAKRG